MLWLCVLHTRKEDYFLFLWHFIGQPGNWREALARA
jgi:hypothetical protein